MHDLTDEESPVSSEKLALERWEDDGGRVGPRPGFETVPPSDGPKIPTKRKSRAVLHTKGFDLD
jgi:hypothetical protein